MNTVCEICGKPANHKFVKIVNGKLAERFLCDEHASETQSLLTKSNLQITFEQLLAKLFQQASQTAAGQPLPQGDIRCGVCGLPFSAYRKTMILGCDRCYESFEELLTADLRKFHGAIRHVGRRPPNFKPWRTKAKAIPVVVKTAGGSAGAAVPAAKAKKAGKGDALSRLREEMNQAVAAEDFERAAQLRDEIRKLESPAASPEQSQLKEH